MFTWINKLFLVLVVAGCVATGDTSAGTGAGPSAMKVLDGAMVAALPQGYCFDPKSLHSERGGIVVIGGRCAAARPVPPAAITVSIGGEGSSAVLQSGARVLTDWARSPAGRAALARDGQPGSVHISETLVVDGAFVIRLQDRAVGPYWRAAIGIKGRLVMISASAPDGGALSTADGRKILIGVIAAMRRANPAT